MDSYLGAKQRKGEVVTAGDLHLLAIVAYTLSSKHEDSTILYVEAFLDRVSQGKFSREEILDKELEVMSTLGFKFNLNKLADQVNSFLHQLLC